MRVRLLAIVPAFLCLASSALAADRPDVKGLYLLADYPAVSVQPGTTANIPIKLQNYGVAPERFQLACRECLPGGPRRCSAAASRSQPRCRQPTRA